MGFRDIDMVWVHTIIDPAGSFHIVGLPHLIEQLGDISMHHDDRVPVAHDGVAVLVDCPCPYPAGQERSSDDLRFDVVQPFLWNILQGREHIDKGALFHGKKLIL